ncbi:MAG TPA: cobalamin-dependent protein, partial [Candidatus Polarisedimenticolia bacterium]|nr:cobalamin-dependent protein [Candidatus Polarisedimenticolia bacterium]
MPSIGNLICVTPRDSYVVDEPIGRNGILGRLERLTGPFMRSPGIGFPYIVGFLRQNGLMPEGCRVVVQHDKIEGPTPFESILEEKADLSRGSVDLVLITSYTNSAREAYRRAREARRAYAAAGRDVAIVLGGAHASAVPDEGPRHGHMDASVVGEGEWAVAEIIGDLTAGRPVKPVYNAGFQRIRDRGTLRIEMDIWQGLRPAPQQVLASATFARGCKLDCHFCAVKIVNGPTVRNRDVQDVVEELGRQIITHDARTIREAGPGFFNGLLRFATRLPGLRGRWGDALVGAMGPGYTRRFFFWDDNLYNAAGAFENLLEAVAPLGRPWSAQLTIDLADKPHLLKKAYEAGCRELFLGIESINQGSLGGIDKWSNEAASTADRVRRVHDAGIKVMGAFVFGLDEDDASVFDRTLEFIHDNGIEYVTANIIQPYPGTGTFQDAVAGGDLLPAAACPPDSDVAMDYNWPLFDGAHVLIRPRNMTEEELQEGYFYFLKEVYSL